ncbi:retrovirus-related pol polyprotein from transposon TNT 1-94 [Tanacetum coccineum]
MGVTRPKKYYELSPTEAIQADGRQTFVAAGYFKGLILREQVETILENQERLFATTIQEVHKGNSTQTVITHNAAYQADDLDMHMTLIVMNLILPKLLSWQKLFTMTNRINKSVNDTLTAELERYKEQVKVLKEGQNVDLKSQDNVSDSCAQSVEIDHLKRTLSEHLKEKESLLQTFFYDNTTKQALGFQNPFYLKKAQQLEPMLYVGDIIQKTNHIVIPDSEGDINIGEECPFGSHNSVSSSEPDLSDRPTNVEVPKELPKVSRVNTSLKKLKYYLANFDVVTKLIAENENLKQTYKQLYDSIKPARIRSKEQCADLTNQVNLKSVEISDLNACLQEKVLVITTLKDELRKLKGTHSAYIKHTQEEAAVLRDLVDHIKANYPLDPTLESAFKFGNDHVAKILGYGDIRLGMLRYQGFYYVEGLGHNLFLWAVLLVLITNLEVLLVRPTSVHVTLEGVDLLTGSRGKKKPYKRISERHQSRKIYLLHMDLCGPIRVASVNGKKYILVIVDDYSRFTWVKLLRSKDEAPDLQIKFLKDDPTAGKKRNRTLIEAARTMLIYAKAPFNYMEVSSDQSSSSDSIHTIVHPDHQISEHNNKWTKDHPLENIIGELARPVSTRLQLHEQALFCYYDAFLTVVEPKTYKDALTQACWIEAMQEELNEFE